MDHYKNNLDEEIILLKKNLMSRDTFPQSTSDLSKVIKDNVIQVINEQKGIYFKDNIREILQEKFGWELAEFNRNFYYREIDIGASNKKIVSVNFPQDIEFKDESYKLVMEENGSLSIINKSKANNDSPTKINANSEISLKYQNIDIFISKIKHFEMDAAYKLDNLDLSFLDEKEISPFHYGIEKNKEFSYIVIEAKLNKYLDLISQLKRDQYYLEKMTDKKILYFGVLNLKELDYDISYKVSDLPCVIFGVSSTLFGKDVNYFYDWPFMKKINNELTEIKSRIGGLEDRVKNIENNMQELKNEVNNINQKLDLLIGNKKKKTKQGDIDESILNKKRKNPDCDDDCDC